MKKINVSKFVLLAGTVVFLTFSSCSKNDKVSNLKQQSTRDVVPVTVYYNESGGATPVIQIGISSADTLNVMLDAGSTGLRILKGSLSNSTYQPSSTRVGYQYGSPASFFIRGSVGTGFFSLGTTKSDSAVGFMAIDQAKYGPNGSYNSTGDSSAIKSGNFRGLNGILGVSLQYPTGSAGVANPLAELNGNGQYIIKLPQYGQTNGSLIINPDASDISGFTLFHLTSQGTLIPVNGFSGWFNPMWSSVFIINGVAYWASSHNAQLDSGNPGTTINSPDVNGSSIVPIGSSITIGFADSINGVLRIQNSLVVGATPLPGKDKIRLQYNATNINVGGILPYFYYDVLYDAKNGVIGLKLK